MFGLLLDLTKIVVAPVVAVAEVVEEAARIVTEPVAEVVVEVSESVREAAKLR